MAGGDTKTFSLKSRPKEVQRPKDVDVSPITHIVVKGAREHNLKNIDLAIPKRKLVVFSGLSGSGKSTMAMETIYAEGQRRYMESLSTYARQFLGELKRPNVDKIEGLSPAIAISQKTTSHNPRSTVGTVTEIYDYFRLLFARVGVPYCIYCGKELQALSKDEVMERIVRVIRHNIDNKFGFKGLLLAPIVEHKKGTYEKLFIQLRKAGWSQLIVDDKMVDLDLGFPKLNKNQYHNILVVVDTFYIDAITDIDKELTSMDFLHRLSSAVDHAYHLDGTRIILRLIKDKVKGIPRAPVDVQDLEFSTASYCKEHDFSVPKLEPRHFSFNSPVAACHVCDGLGFIRSIDPKLLVDKEKTILEGAIYPFDRFGSKVPDPFDKQRTLFFTVVDAYNIPLSVPVKDIAWEKVKLLLEGDNKPYTIRLPRLNRELTLRFKGIIKFLEDRYSSSKSDIVKREIERFMVDLPCPACKGRRLKPEFLAVNIDGLNIHEVGQMSIKDLKEWVNSLILKLKGARLQIAKPILKEISLRLSFLESVGLGYLTLNRSSNTLSGGEAQRIRLASQVGTGLTDVVYVLDEPSIGLHARDQNRLITTLQKLRDLGNTVIVVEHDEETILAADYVVDFGPRAGREGGRVVFSGTVNELIKNKESLTALYVSGRRSVRQEVYKRLKKEGIELSLDKTSARQYIELVDVNTHNLKGVTVRFPLNRFVVVTGVSGSGKSSLVVDTLYPALARQLGYRVVDNAKYEKIRINGVVHRSVLIDQSPIGRTPRSNPATYTGVFDDIRRLFANTKDAKLRGYPPGYFSFNVRGGRCEACRGEGQVKVEMMFLPDVYVTCDVCGGSRYTREVLQIRYRGKNIADVLNMTISEALEFFEGNARITRKLRLLADVGLGYMQLGQPAPTLSGGEAQRVKLAAELQRTPTKKTVYILDEPTTGLHFEDIVNLLVVLRRLVARGDTVIVIEHNLDFVSVADWVIDLGPEGGDEGGRIVYSGPLADILDIEASYTGMWLKRLKKLG